MKKIQFELSADGRTGYLYCFYLSGKEDLGDFIKEEKPPQCDYNAIPIKKWFIYEEHECDNSYCEFVLVSDYIKGSFEEILSISDEITRLKKIIEQCQ